MKKLALGLFHNSSPAESEAPGTEVNRLFYFPNKIKKLKTSSLSSSLSSVWKEQFRLLFFLLEKVHLEKISNQICSFLNKINTRQMNILAGLLILRYENQFFWIFRKDFDAIFSNNNIILNSYSSYSWYINAWFSSKDHSFF